MNVKRLKEAPTYRFAALAIIVAAYMEIYAGIQLTAALSQQLADGLSIGSAELAVVSIAATVGMSLFQYLAGDFITRFGGKKVLIAGLLLQGTAGVLFLFAGSSFVLTLIFRILQGFGAGSMSACCTGLAACWFPKRERSLASGVMAGSYGLSLLIVTQLAAVLDGKGMRWNLIITLILGVSGFVEALVVAVFYRDIEKEYGVRVIDNALVDDVPEKGEPYSGKLMYRASSWAEMVRYPAFYLLAVIVFCYCFCVFGLSYMLPLLFQSLGYGIRESAAFQSVIFISTILSSPLGGILSDKIFGSRRAITVVCSFAGMFLFFVPAAGQIASGKAGISLVVLCTLSYFFVTMAPGPVWVMPVEIFSSSFAMKGTGICLVIAQLGGIVAVLLQGALGGIDPGSILVCCFFAAAASWVLHRKYRV